MLKLIAPFRALFSLDSSLIAASPASFTEFLKLLSHELENPESDIGKKLDSNVSIEVNVPVETSETEIGSRYVSLNANGSLYLSPRIFTIRFKPSAINDIDAIYNYAAAMADEVTSKYSRHFLPDIGTFRIDVQDNTIATLSLELVVNRSNINKNDYAWNRLDEWTTVLVHFLLYKLYPAYIFPALKNIREFSKKHGYVFVQDIADYTIFLDLIGDTDNPYPDLQNRFMLMWVNRTLCYNGDYPANGWIKPLIGDKGSLKIGNAEMHLNAGNSVVIMPPNMDKNYFSQLWDVILSSQYYYAALDVVNLNLVRHIGTTFNKQTSKNLRRLSREMEAIINRVTILQVRYHDFAMELQGMPRKIFHVLQKEWDFNTLAGNVYKKLELCKSNINVLNQETNSRNQGRTEIVLTSLTGMGILNLFVELGNYATQMPPEHMHMVGDMPGFMDLGFMMSGNALSWIGIIIAVAVIIFTVYNRRG